MALSGETLTFTKRDGSTQDINLPGGTGGLAAVSSDGTLTGDGTSGDPLKVADPVPQAVSAAEKTAGTETADRSFSPKDIADMVAGHESDTPQDAATWAREGNTDTIPNAKLPSDVARDSDIPNVPARAGAFTAADEAKLDGIEAGAQKNPLNVVRFSALSADTADGVQDAEIGFYNGSTQVQSGQMSQADAIDVPDAGATLGQDPEDAATDLDAVNTTRYFGDLLENGGALILALYNQETQKTTYVAASTIAAKTGGWRLTNLTFHASQPIAGTNDKWNIVASHVDALLTKDIVDLAQVLTAYVQRTELEGHETDRYASYNNAFVGNSYRTGSIVLTTDTSGAPTTANQVRQPDFAAGSGTIAFGRLRKDADPDHFVLGEALAPADYPSGTVLFMEVHNRPGDRLTITTTADATLVGTGDAQYVYAPASWTVSGTPGDVVDDGDYFLLATEKPTKVKLEIPATDILGLISWLKRQVTNAADPIDGETKLLLANWTGLSIDHLERHFADRYLTFGGYSVVASNAYDAKGEMDASVLNNANAQIRAGVKDGQLTDWISEIAVGELVEVYRNATNYYLGRVSTNTADSFKSGINGRYVNLSTISKVGTIGAGDTVDIRLYRTGDGLVPIPEAGDAGKVLKASGANAYAWADGFKRTSIEVLNSTSFGTSFTTLGKTDYAYDDNTWFKAVFYALASGHRRIASEEFRLGDLSNNDFTIPWGWADAAGYRVAFKRSAADTLQYRREPAGLSDYRLRLYVLPDGP